MTRMTITIFTFCSVFAFYGSAIAANADQNPMPSGTWTCTHTEPGYQTSRTLQFVGNRLIHTDGLGRKYLVPDAAISPELVVWNNGSAQEFEFDPIKGILTERDTDLGTTMTYQCQKS